MPTPTETSPPDQARLTAALEATWPPLRQWPDGPFVHRDGGGGGQRVSASTLRDPMGQDLQSRIAEMDQPLFRVSDTDHAANDAMNAAGLVSHDDTLFRAAPASALQAPPKIAQVFFGWPGLAMHKRLWAAGGIGPGRLAVMTRVSGPKTALLLRAGDAPAGVAFVAMDGPIAMLHAVEVSPAFRRQGLGRVMTTAAAFWAHTNGADWFALAVTRQNAEANALYATLGLETVGGYHYRVRPKGTE